MVRRLFAARARRPIVYEHRILIRVVGCPQQHRDRDGAGEELKPKLPGEEHLVLCQSAVLPLQGLLHLPELPRARRAEDVPRGRGLHRGGGVQPEAELWSGACGQPHRPERSDGLDEQRDPQVRGGDTGAVVGGHGAGLRGVGLLDGRALGEHRLVKVQAGRHAQVAPQPAPHQQRPTPAGAPHARLPRGGAWRGLLERRKEPTSEAHRQGQPVTQRAGRLAAMGRGRA